MGSAPPATQPCCRPQTDLRQPRAPDPQGGGARPGPRQPAGWRPRHRPCHCGGRTSSSNHGHCHTLLLGVQHQKTLARRQPVHARAGCQVPPGLSATMQHDQQRKQLPRGRCQPRGHKKMKAPSPGRAGRNPRQPLGRRASRWNALGPSPHRFAGHHAALNRRALLALHRLGHAHQRRQVALVGTGQRRQRKQTAFARHGG